MAAKIIADLEGSLEGLPPDRRERATRWLDALRRSLRVVLRCQNCHQRGTVEYGTTQLLCDHVLCEYCAKDGCPICAEEEARDFAAEFVTDPVEKEVVG